MDGLYKNAFRTMIPYMLARLSSASFSQSAVVFPGVLGVTAKRRWKTVDFLSSHAVSIGARGRFKEVLTAFSIPVSGRRKAHRLQNGLISD